MLYEDDEYEYQKAYYREQKVKTTNCGGWGSYEGPCGSLDCINCYPGSAEDYALGQELEPCQCGKMYWDENFRCTKCGTGPAEVSFRRSSEHTARCDHVDGTTIVVRAGARYRRTVIGGHYPGGPKWLRVEKEEI